ncbi:hypothetical protein B0A55_01848 [Friedmanniomyces simplex]|uniref:ADF-H domain-containing protein n=1 Tax=Friedmanniomyces simplex TaxID=329884 RepID=A0A4U0XGZ4_9PEZI|nr:hypothetical protein B0A55_01848 [Friedmanniomyces simplex]
MSGFELAKKDDILVVVVLKPEPLTSELWQNRWDSTTWWGSAQRNFLAPSDLTPFVAYSEVSRYSSGPVVNMSSESRLYSFSQETKDRLRKFRLGTSRAKDPQAIISPKEDQIDKSSMEIKQADEEVYTSMQELADELPDNSARVPKANAHISPENPFIDGGDLLQASGRLSVPYLMLNYLPPTCSSEMRMLYAGAKELMRNQAEAGRILEIDSAEELEGIEERLKGED